MDETPVAALYERHAEAIFLYLRLHAASTEDAEDLLLEVFLAALEWEPLSALPSEDQLAWLRQVARNKLIDQYRRVKRRPVVGLEQVAAVMEDDEARAPEQVALRQEERHRLRLAVQRLPALQQQILRLRFGDGLRAAQIAALVGKREDAVRKLLSRTLTSLRTLYGER
jgi:RNA polymerase sigma factor (sigma-70 family)